MEIKVYTDPNKHTCNDDELKFIDFRGGMKYERRYEERLAKKLIGMKYEDANKFYKDGHRYTKDLKIVRQNGIVIPMGTVTCLEAAFGINVEVNDGYIISAFPCNGTGTWS